MINQLPRDSHDGPIQQWKCDLAVALGYTTEETEEAAPTIWHLPQDNPFGFLEETNEVVIWEIDGPDDERGMRTAQLDASKTELKLRPIRRPMPADFELVTVTTDDGVTHRIALPKAAGEPPR